MTEIKVEVEKLDKNAMFLKQHLGSGKLGDTEFDATLALPTMSMIVEVGGERYMVKSQSLISAIVEHAVEDTKK